MAKEVSTNEVRDQFRRDVSIRIQKDEHRLVVPDPYPKSELIQFMDRYQKEEFNINYVFVAHHTHVLGQDLPDVRFHKPKFVDDEIFKVHCKYYILSYLFLVWMVSESFIVSTIWEVLFLFTRFDKFW